MKHQIISILSVAVLSAVTASPVWAEGRHDGGRGEGRHEMHPEGRHWGGDHDISHFEDHHLSVWRGGNWHHGSHEGRFGWWWIVAGTWYFYPGPIYPYPDPYLPPVVVVQATPGSATPAPQPAAQSWYYCEASKTYYPYVSTCPAGWKAVPATPPKPVAKQSSETVSPPVDPSY